MLKTILLQNNLNTVLVIISKTTSPTSDPFLLIMSRICTQKFSLWWTLKIGKCTKTWANSEWAIPITCVNHTPSLFYEVLITLIELENCWVLNLTGEVSSSYPFAQLAGKIQYGLLRCLRTPPPLPMDTNEEGKKGMKDKLLALFDRPKNKIK